MPAYFCILPILTAILIAFSFNKIIPALLSAVFVSIALLVYQNNLSISEIIELVSTLIPNILFDYTHLSVLIFSVFITAMIYISIENGSFSLITQQVSKFANTRKKQC